MNGRSVLLALGVLAALFGLGVAFLPSLAGIVESPEEIPLLLGVTALLAAILRLRSWLGHEERELEPSNRERPTGIDPPGTAFDRKIERSPARATRGNTRLIMVRQSLREAAIDALTTYHGHTEESAEAAINAGTWTDDEYAVEFFTTAGGAGNSLSETVSSSFYGEMPFHRRADHAARSIDQLTRRER